MMDDDLTAEVQRVAAAVVEAHQAGADGRLDYSEESLAAVEALLHEASDFVDGMSEKQVDDVARQFGCYILEVARRKWGGRYQWYPDRDAPVLVVGEPGFRVAMLTWDKTKGRLLGDEADNIPFFYAGFAERVRGAANGVNVLYV
ncbi:hypothetical protein [Micromonospora sp. CPCC 205561]|uniref:hypothetical protein n=1 Tax=Micromonospora sp. CPCC 205561 TaxID=3122407 RepID=UPI002FF1CCC7